MLGTKKLSEIKKELRLVLQKTDEDFQSWLDQKILEHRKSTQDAKVLEDLLWVQKILAESVTGKMPPQKEPRKAPRKKTPVA